MAAEKIRAVDGGLQIVQAPPHHHNPLEGVDVGMVSIYLQVADRGQGKLLGLPLGVDGQNLHRFRQVLQAPVQGAVDILLPEGLRQVVGGPDIEALQSVIQAGGDKDNGRAAAGGAEPAGRLHAGQAGHIDVQKEDPAGRNLLPGRQ